MSTYEPIASQTLGSAAASVTFSSIPQGYTDLVIVAQLTTAAPTNMRIRFNGDATANYSNTTISGNGSTATSVRETGNTAALLDWNAYPTSTTIANLIINIMNYANATTFKTFINRANNASGGTEANVGLWRSTNAINEVQIRTSSGGNISAGSTFSLYGIQVGDKAQKAQGGNIVTSDGTYVYHTFTSSGAFIPSQALTVDYLVVAGGGGGSGGASGADTGGGGGAGGLRSTVTATGGGGSLESALSLSAGKSYPVIVGAGGSGGPGGTPSSGTNGNDSIFATITSLGGGKNPGGTGGSGGGGKYNVPAAGLGTANQGYNGGAATTSSPYTSGGGGGAGQAGTAGASGGAGGNGVAISISGSSVTYAGGGGAGATASGGSAASGGTGGGGAGSANSGSATAGTANLGGGGGGGAEGGSTAGAAGGSGIVIIRYAI